jgi:dihydroorotase
MAERFDLLVQGGVVVTPSGRVAVDLGVRDGRIAALGDLAGAVAAARLDATGLHVLPGVIDPHVHLREPGGEQKEDIATGTTAAVLGGVTAVADMPNTSPPTTSADALADKLRRAAGRARCDIGFWIGATAENVDALGELEATPGCAGVKLYMGSSTGGLLVADDATIARLLRSGRRRVGIHAEDEERLRERRRIAEEGEDPALHPSWRDPDTAVRATRRILALARAAGRRVHLLHVSTGDELPLLAEHRDIAAVEVTPQHLTLSAPGCYERLASRAQMNPPLRHPDHREALWDAVAQGLVDTIGSDHAPHTLEEKARPYPGSPSGLPGVQTLVPVLLDHVHAGRMTLERMVDLTSAGPARVLGIAGKGRIARGYDADLTLVDLAARRTITDAAMASRCGWTPYDGMEVNGWPIATVVRGEVVMREGELIGEPAGRPLRFLEALQVNAG